MILDILTPEAHVFHGNVDYVTMPGLEGQFQVLTGHAAIISALKSGMLTFKAMDDSLVNEHLTTDNIDSKVFHYKISGGVAEMLGEHVVVLAE
jgi:F-type H+-transporting ATPase subunit epsilon